MFRPLPKTDRWQSPLRWLGIVACMAQALALLLPPSTGRCADDEPQLAPARLFTVRDGLANVRGKLDAGRSVTVAYIGGSITQSQKYLGWPASWSERATEWIRSQWPAADVKHVNAAIGGTDSELAAYRLERDLLQHQPDLVFVEFAVNDWRRNQKEAVAIMEGIVRHIWKQLPAADVCFVYTFRENFWEDLAAGKCPSTASAHEIVAEHYGIPSINVALRVADLLKAGKLLLVPPTDRDGKEVPPPPGVKIFSNDRLHPQEGGIQIYHGLVTEALPHLFAKSRPPSPRLKPPLVPDNPWENARAAPLEKRSLSAGWSNRISNPEFAERYEFWRKVLPTPWAPDPWEARAAGEEIHLKFRGKRLNLYDMPGPDGVSLRVAVDGQEGDPLLRFEPSEAFPYRMVLIAQFHDDLVHDVKLSILPPGPLPGNADRQTGTAYRVKGLLLIGDVVD